MTSFAAELAESTAPERRSELLDAVLSFRSAEDKFFVFREILSPAQQRDVVRALGERYGRQLDEGLVETIRRGWLREEAWW